MAESGVSHCEGGYVVKCPHCHGHVFVPTNEVNCTIFRHAVLKDSGEQLNPHANKATCDRLRVENKIYGCGRPFKFDGQSVSVCGYI